MLWVRLLLPLWGQPGGHMAQSWSSTVSYLPGQKWLVPEWTHNPRWANQKPSSLTTHSPKWFLIGTDTLCCACLVGGGSEASKSQSSHPQHGESCQRERERTRELDALSPWIQPSLRLDFILLKYKFPFLLKFFYSSPKESWLVQFIVKVSGLSWGFKI